MKQVRLLLIIALLICFAAATFGCTNYYNNPLHRESDQWGTDSLLSINETELSFKRSFGLKSGELVYSISNPRLVSTMQDIPATSVTNHGFISENTFYLQPDTSISYPDFLDSNGSFIDGTYLLLIDITVESEDATSFTVQDTDSTGLPRGQFEDPYIFRAEDIIYLADSADLVEYNPKLPTEKWTYFYGISFYSGLGSCSEHDLAYRVEPHGSTSFTVGFAIDDAEYGGRFSLDSMSLCNSIDYIA